MCEQTGQEIDWERCPPDLEDFPEIVITAIQIYNSLGDRIYPDVGYTGKDYTNLPLLYELHHIKEESQKDYILELLLIIQAIQIKDSQDRIKAEMDKMKKK